MADITRETSRYGNLQFIVQISAINGQIDKVTATNNIEWFKVTKQQEQFTFQRLNPKKTPSDNILQAASRFMAKAKQK